MRSCLSTPPSAAKGPPAQPILARRDHARGLRQPPVCRHAPKTFLPNLSQTLVNSRPSLVRALIPVQPLHPPQKGLQRALCPARDARGLRQPPVCHVAPKISCPISHILSQSLIISRASRLPVNPFNRPNSASNVNPVRNRDAAGQSNNCIMAVSPALTQYEIRNSAPNLLLSPCKSLDHRISCTHRRKSKAAADHLCTLTNVYGLTEQPQLQDHNAAAPDAKLCSHPQNFFQREQRNT